MARSIVVPLIGLGPERTAQPPSPPSIATCDRIIELMVESPEIEYWVTGCWVPRTMSVPIAAEYSNPPTVPLPASITR